MTFHKVITVRMSEELHEALKEEAYQRRISMNTLCLMKLQPPVSIYKKLPSSLDTWEQEMEKWGPAPMRMPTPSEARKRRHQELMDAFKPKPEIKEHHNG